MSGRNSDQDGLPPGARRLSESLRGLTEAQRQSVAAASGLFDQLIDQVRQRETRSLNVTELLDPLSADGDGTATLAQIRRSVTRAIDLYSDLASETFALYADAIEQILRADGGTRPAGTSAAGAPVLLTGRPGEETAGTVWIHNLSSSPLTGARLWMTSLTNHGGDALGGITCVFSPAVLDVEEGSSAPTTISVTLPSDAAAGAYHGLVLASGAPAASVPVLLTVG